MSSEGDFVFGWEVQARRDGSFAVCDTHGLVDGPFGTREEALAAALRLPKHPPAKHPSTPRETAASAVR
jgi:hypothetical protein